MALSVVYVQDTGHVVGAVALTGARPAADAGSLVGTGLPLRISVGSVDIATLSLQDKRLAVAAAGDEPAVFADPLAFGVELGPAPEFKPKPTLRRLAPWSGVQDLDLRAALFKITVPVAVTDDTPVLVLISRAQDTDVLFGKVPAEKRDVTFQVDLTTGDTHGVLVLVAGQAGRFEAVTVQ